MINKRNLFEMHDSIETISHKVYLDLKIEEETIGRIVIGLYDQIAHLAVKNFRHLCGGYDLSQKNKDSQLSYQGYKALKVLKYSHIQFGPPENDTESIYGVPFKAGP